MKKLQRISTATLIAIFICACPFDSGDNHPPLALPEQFRILPGASIEVELKALDLDGDTITIYIDRLPKHGTLHGKPPLVTYTPEPGFRGVDKFSFYAEDYRGAGPSANIKVAVGVWFVNDDATGNGAGENWKDAFTGVQQALDAATAGEMVWVAEGTYVRDSDTITDPVLTMKDGVEVYGGFIGRENSLSKRGDPLDHETILDGESTSWHVVLGASDAVLDGFMIARGNADGDLFPDDMGGGMFNEYETENLVIENCHFRSNYALYGGGISNYVSLVEIRNSVFTGNVARQGGAVYNRGYQVTFFNCDFIDNVGSFDGGAIYNQSSPYIEGCRFTGNHGGLSGGAISSFTNSNVEVKDSDFIMNQASMGGALYHSERTLKLEGCLFSQNQSSSSGGALSLSSVSSNIERCEFIENQSGNDGGAIDNGGSGLMDLSDSLFKGNQAVRGGALSNNITTNYTENTQFISNQALRGGAIYIIDLYSSYLDNCILSGNSASDQGGALYILNSELSMKNNVFHENHAANRGGAIYIELYSIGAHLLNSIVWGNQAPSGKDIYKITEVPLGGDRFTISYNDIEQSGFAPDNGNISADPLFSSTDEGGFQLSPSSPCIDAGDPDPAQNDPDGTRNDMGAYGGPGAAGWWK